MPGNRRWTEVEDALVLSRYIDTPYVDIAAAIGRTELAVRLRRKSLALPTKLERHEVDDLYFDVIDTETKAYLLGLISADGWVGTHTAGGHVLTLPLQKRDIAAVTLLRDSITPRKAIYLTDKTVRLDVRLSPHLYYVLSDVYGVSVGRKPHFVLPSTIPTALHHAFWLGYYDGDGGICRTKRGHLVWYICGGLPSMQQFCNQIAHHLGIHKIPRRHHKVTWLHYVYLYAEQDILRLDAWIHQSGLGLARKYANAH